MVKLEEKNNTKSTLLMEHAEHLWNQLNLFETPYFSSLENGTMGREDFITSQQAFFYAVSYFSRPMSALACRIDSTCARVQLVENIYEEHGEINEELFHETTFKRFLDLLNSESSKIEKDIPLEPCVDAFNSALMGVCQSAPVEKGICCLGMIEYMFAFISKFIAETIVDHGWISSENLIHYNLHAELDIKHSRDLFEIIDKIPETRINICKEGIRLGAFIFCKLYDDLAKQKAERPLWGL